MLLIFSVLKNANNKMLKENVIKLRSRSESKIHIIVAHLCIHVINTRYIQKKAATLQFSLFKLYSVC